MNEDEEKEMLSQLVGSALTAASDEMAKELREFSKKLGINVGILVSVFDPETRETMILTSYQEPLFDYDEMADVLKKARIKVLFNKNAHEMHDAEKAKATHQGSETSQ